MRKLLVCVYVYMCVCVCGRTLLTRGGRGWFEWAVGGGRRLAGRQPLPVTPFQWGACSLTGIRILTHVRLRI